MSDTESHQASIDASEASIPAENGPREVENDPPPLGSDEERESDPGVAARTRFQRRLEGLRFYLVDFYQRKKLVSSQRFIILKWVQAVGVSKV